MMILVEQNHRLFLVSTHKMNYCMNILKEISKFKGQNRLNIACANVGLVSKKGPQSSSLHQTFNADGKDWIMTCLSVRSLDLLFSLVSEIEHRVRGGGKMCACEVNPVFGLYVNGIQAEWSRIGLCVCLCVCMCECVTGVPADYIADDECLLSAWQACNCHLTQVGEVGEKHHSENQQSIKEGESGEMCKKDEGRKEQNTDPLFKWTLKV